jgi:hypothetical protein
VTIQIVMPKGAFGASPDDDLLDSILRKIADAAETDPGAWATKYGTNYENDVFMMHEFCWCEREDCPWCCGCECDSEDVVYTVDGKPVTYEQWMQFYEDNVPDIEPGRCTDKQWAEWERISDEINARRDWYIPVDKQCDFCRTGGISVAYGGEPGRGAPNFWYKPLDFKVWWYKYIGRSMETNKTLTDDQIRQVLEHCLDSLKDRRNADGI